LEAKSQAEAGAGTPAQLLPEVQEICESLSFEPPDYFAALRRGLEQVEEIPNPELPLDLTVSLRSYQRVGVAWLNFLRTHGLSGLLADDMGLGKTLQALCIIQGRALVVAPASVIHAWRLQAEKFRPRLKVSVYHGPARSLDPAADLTITTYGLVRSDVGELEGVSWDTLVLDEAQVFRNPDSLLAGAIRRLKAAFRVNLSGTPIENSLDDLWSQFAVLLPGLLGSRQEFHEIAQRIEAGDSSEALRLQNRVRPFILRRLKRDVAPELPEKTEVVLYADLSHDERTAYQAILGSTRREILDSMDAGLQEDIPVFSLLETLMRLRQACCHRALLPAMDAVQSSSKLELLSECLRNSISQGHRALVFSQWTSFLDLIEPHLRAMNCSFSRIDGSTKDRHVVTEEFQKPDGPQVMLLSLKAGGLGLTLTAADHVYIVDPWWNPAAEEQAADRVYRIGQENPVMVHRLVARDTVEERVLALQEQKRALAAAVVGDKGESVRLSFTRAEMLTLLE
jgi:SNF2 family DNA or RNA helicase